MPGFLAFGIMQWSVRADFREVQQSKFFEKILRILMKDRVGSLLIGSLAVMGRPSTFGEFHMRENGSEGGILRTARIDAEPDFVFCIEKMTYPHLVKENAVFRIFYAEVIFSAAQAIPHGSYLCRYFGCCPVGVSVIGYHTAQVLELSVFIFHRSFKPVFTVQVQHNAALIKAVIAFGKIGFHHEGKEFFFCCHLKNGRIVIPEVIIGPLPQIRLRIRSNFNAVLRKGIVPGGSCPFQLADIEGHIFHLGCKSSFCFVQVSALGVSG